MTFANAPLRRKDVRFDRRRVAVDLRRLAGTRAVVDGERGLRPSACDGLTAYRRMANS